MHTPDTRKLLELSAAQEVGRIFFEYSRLDFLLWLTLRDNVEPMELAEKKVAAFHTAEKIKRLEQRLKKELAGDAKRLQQAEDWISRAEVVREHRNSFAHGRWIPEANGLLVNVTVSRSTGQQESKTYTLDQLVFVRSEAEVLQMELNKLRKGWQL